MVETTTEKCWDELSMAGDDVAREMSIRLNTNLTLLDLTADAIMLNADLDDEKTVLSYLEDVQKKTIFDRIDVVFPDGSVLLQSIGRRVSDGGEKSYDELVSVGSHVSPRVSDFLTGKPAVHAFSPVYNAAGEPVAILGATIYCSTLGEIFYSSHYGDDALLFLVDRRDGALVLDKLHEVPGSIYDMEAYETPGEYGDKDFISEIINGKTGRVHYTSELYGNTAYTIYTPIEDTDYSLTMVVQEDVALADLEKTERTLALVGIVEIAILSLLIIWIYFIMRRSMENENRAQQAELELMHKKEQVLKDQYQDATNRREFLEAMALNLPGGYHRCTTDHKFKLTFVSNSFTEITGYTMEQLNDELDGSYMGIVAPEDRDYFMSLVPQLERDGYIHCSYRMRRRDGVIRWVQDTTQYVERDGEQYYQCALMDISEQIEEIEQARQEAEESSRAKSTFLFNISHDIRTPMNAIKGFSNIIKENADNVELVRSTVDKLEQAGNSLMMLINDVLDISRIERGKEELSLQPTDIYELGKNLYELFSSEMKSAGIEFKAEGDLLHDRVYCDSLKLTRIMMNMLSNAKKFTPAGGSVTFGGVRLKSDAESCTYRFFVKDTGIGMSPEFQKRAFDQFERERTSTESKIAGSGLGLAIIKMMVELMNGTVELKSELGKGTEISAIITFKLADKDTVGKQSLEQGTENMTGKRVLLVEDNEFNREIAKYVLEGMGFTVDEAENGAVCIEKLMSAPAGCYDLVLMDIQMPIMDGYTATTEIRNLSDKSIAGIPIVAMTANAFDEDRRKCIAVGMNGHVGKPIDMSDLKKVLSEIFSKKED